MAVAEAAEDVCDISVPATAGAVEFSLAVDGGNGFHGRVLSKGAHEARKGYLSPDGLMKKADRRSADAGMRMKQFYVFERSDSSKAGRHGIAGIARVLMYPIATAAPASPYDCGLLFGRECCLDLDLKEA